MWLLPLAHAQDTGTPAAVSAPPLPVEVRVEEQVIGVMIVKQVGPQILVRADDLPGSGLALPLTCAAGQYLSLPGELNPQLDTTTLVLRLGRNALQVQASEPDLPAPDSLQTTGTLSVDSDTRLRVQPETVAGAEDVQALGVRSSSFGVHLADGQVFIQASVAGAYLYWQLGLLEADFGLIPAGVQSDLGA